MDDLSDVWDCKYIIFIINVTSWIKRHTICSIGNKSLLKFFFLAITSESKKYDQTQTNPFSFYFLAESRCAVTLYKSQAWHQINQTEQPAFAQSTFFC